MSSLDNFEPGVYRIATRQTLNDVENIIHDAALDSFFVNGQNINDKVSFIREFAKELKFPAYCGYNWDAFEECISDLSWLPAKGYAIFFMYPDHFIQNNKTDWQTVILIFRSIIRYWKEQGVLFYILLYEDKTHIIDSIPILYL